MQLFLSKTLAEDQQLLHPAAYFWVLFTALFCRLRQ